jgi:trehalose 6-phosphate synthase
MRLSLRFVIPLALALGAIGYGVVPLVDDLTLRWFVRDLDMRAGLIASAAQEPFGELIDAESGVTVKPRLRTYFDRLLQDERLFALGFCDRAGRMLYRSTLLPDEAVCREAADPTEETGRVLKLPGGSLHVAARPVLVEGNHLGKMVVVHDMSFIERRSADTRKYVVYLFIGLGAIIALITALIAELSWRGWTSGIKALIRGQSLALAPQAPSAELQPIARDLEAMVKSLDSARRTRDASKISWSADSVRGILREDLKGDEIIIVSNREPYIHARNGGGQPRVKRPASGLVTALEPVMRACSGTWIAHGSGDADREAVDEHDRERVPPGKPEYVLRRIWLEPEEEAGYYYGFSNEGLWPLCHIAHTRPVFRAADWAHYREVNRRFADAVAQEARTEDPIVLVQDYHFALLPRLVRERLPKATVITFWHIPWPNPEAFGICPWRKEILEGLLGSSILGFHTQVNCNNFMDSVDRYLEARVDRDAFTVSFRGEPTEVRAYPIAIEWPPLALREQKPVEECRRMVLEKLGLPADVRLGIGIDRLDYTKGILERFSAIERLLEMEPALAGKFCFVQIAAPSRGGIEEYRSLDERVRASAQRINERHAGAACPPIKLLIEHHNAETVFCHYRAADLCFVSSLHDGMNLVAKEYVSARDDERGVLVLSQFTGAAREMTEALVVNPYDTEQCAAALRAALAMPPSEQRTRMRSMRAQAQEFNVFRWAGRMLLDAARTRQRRELAAVTREPAAPRIQQRA